MAASALPLHGISIIGALLELLKGGCYGQGGGGGVREEGGRDGVGGGTGEDGGWREGQGGWGVEEGRGRMGDGGREGR